MRDKLVFQYLPVIAALGIILGLWLGKGLYENAQGVKKEQQLSQLGKFDQLFYNINQYYVDSVNDKELSDFTIRKMLEHLDPHSSYIPAELVPSTNEELAGNFDGIGIEYRIIEDTIYVMHIFQKGPSYKAGLKAGDQIVWVNDSMILAKNLSAKNIVPLLKGPKGSEVKVGILRNNERKDLIIQRGEIAVPSIPYYTVLKDSIGYIKITGFTQRTYSEFSVAAEFLKDKNIKGLIIDVRDNPGGYLDQVVKVCDELLPNDLLIAYTKGRAESETFTSSKNGVFAKLPLAILIDENSASASEILAGSMQDHDRATIVGRRSFGKGLVQSPFHLSDGSIVRITISRYYTPSGRCIQRPYEKDKESYYHAVEKRWETGEMYSEDSITITDTTKFYTDSGKIVLGGGGIWPDVFTPFDSTFNTQLLRDIYAQQLVDRFVVTKLLGDSIPGDNVAEAFGIISSSWNLTPDFKAFVQANGITWQEQEFEKSKSFILDQITSILLRTKFDSEGYYYPRILHDSELDAAIRVFD